MKRLLRLIIIALALTVSGASSPAFAASPTPVPVLPSLSLPFTGQFLIQPAASSTAQPTANLQGQTTGSLPISFSAQLTPAQFAQPSERVRAVLLKGTATVQDLAAKTPLFQGSAQATLNSDGTGALGILANGTGQYQGVTLTLEGNFTADQNGSVSGLFTGGMSGVLAQSAPTAPAPPVDHTYWFISRAAGITAYLLLFVAVMLGLAIQTKAGDAVLGRWRVFDLHQAATLTAVGFLVLHIFSLLGDQFVGFSVSQLLIPFTAPYRVLPVAAGIIGFYLILLLTASFFVRRWIGYRTWRTLHYATFLVFGLALVHGIFAGTDTPQLWMRAMYWITGLAVGAFTVYRMPPHSTATPPPPAPVSRAQATRSSRGGPASPSRAKGH